MDDNRLETLYNSLNQAIKDECNETITVAFSGGIDSTLVAFIANKYCNIELIAVGVPGSHDLEAAKSAAKLIGTVALAKAIASSLNVLIEINWPLFISLDKDVTPGTAKSAP